jgi:hypothetical protein
MLAEEQGVLMRKEEAMVGKGGGRNCESEASDDSMLPLEELVHN